jgi:hypothetical protein
MKIKLAYITKNVAASFRLRRHRPESLCYRIFILELKIVKLKT